VAPPRAARKPRALPKAEQAAPAKARDPRLPSVGTTMERVYKGVTHRVAVLAAGFLYEGATYSSLSALAAHITGAKAINGFAWFGLTVKTGAPAEAL
jgi:hypothetical protein